MGPWGLLPAALPALFSATLSPALSVYLCGNVGPQGLLVVRLPAPFVTSLGPATATGILSTLVPVSAPPTGLDVCFFFIYLVSNFLAVRFSVKNLFLYAQNRTKKMFIAVTTDPQIWSRGDRGQNIPHLLLKQLSTILKGA